jgi:hypothetical protein
MPAALVAVPVLAQSQLTVGDYVNWYTEARQQANGALDQARHFAERIDADPGSPKVCEWMQEMRSSMGYARMKGEDMMRYADKVYSAAPAQAKELWQKAKELRDSSASAVSELDATIAKQCR